jgi:hypothetical protein
MRRWSSDQHILWSGKRGQGTPSGFPEVRMGILWLLPCESGRGTTRSVVEGAGNLANALSRASRCPPPSLRPYSPRCAGGEPTSPKLPLAQGRGCCEREFNYQDAVGSAFQLPRYRPGGRARQAKRTGRGGTPPPCFLQTNRRRSPHCGETGPERMSGSFRCSAFQRIAMAMRLRPEG